MKHSDKASNIYKVVYTHIFSRKTFKLIPFLLRKQIETNFQLRETTRFSCFKMATARR